MDVEENKKEQGEERDRNRICNGFTKEGSTMLGVSVGLVVLLVVIAVTSIATSHNSDRTLPFPTDGDMLEYLLQNGDIGEKDGLHVTWYHSANSKAQMDKALKSSAMVLEADVNVEGYNTVNQTDTPIMAHPPDVYSDNTLQEWLERVLKSRKGIKLDFKSIEAVEPSLDILWKSNKSGINRPVWLNADILRGPNVPTFWPVVNATRFLDLVQRKFPDSTISPGWKVQYLSFVPNATYSRAMVEEMYRTVGHMPQRVTFPVHALMVKQAWPHLSWLLSQSPRFTLTLWQGKESPSLSDLLFVRDNSHPQRVYYDIYEPVLSQFKEEANRSNRARYFYPGGDVIEYFHPDHKDGVYIQWHVVTDKTSLLTIMRDYSDGMLVIPIGSNKDRPEDPFVENSNPGLTLVECLDLVHMSSKRWGFYFQIPSQNLLSPTLQILSKAFDDDRLYRPTWINMNVAYKTFHIPGYIDGQEFLDTVNAVFPHVTLAPGWPPEALEGGYTTPLVETMISLFKNTWQKVSLQLLAVPLGKSYPGRQTLLKSQKRFSLTVMHGPAHGEYNSGFLGLMSIRSGDIQRSFYNMPNDYKSKLFLDLFTS